MSASPANSAAAQTLGEAPQQQSGDSAAADDRLLSPSEFRETFGLDPGPPPSAEFAERWLDWQCRMISGVQAGGVFLIDRIKGATLQAAACWPADSPECPHLRKVATEAVLGRAGIIQKRRDDGVAASVLTDSVAYPLVVNDRVVGTVALTLTMRSEPQQKAVLQLLQWGIVWLEGMLANQPKRRDRLGTKLTELIAELLENKPLPLLANHICGAIADELGCRRVALGLVKGLQVQALALSHQLRFDPRVAGVAAIESAMEECLDQDKPVLVAERVDPEQGLTRAHDELSKRHDHAPVCSIPLRDGERVVGVLTLLGATANSFTEEDIAATGEAAALLGPILGLKLRDQESLGRRVLRVGRSVAANLVGAGHLGVKLAVASGLIALALLAVLEADQRVSARSTVEGSLQQAIVAPHAGYVATAQARAGDVVEEGFVLAALDDRDLLLEQERWSSERAKHAREHQEALATRDRARVSVLAARMAQADAQLRLIEEKLKRTRLRAPFSGVVVSGDLSRALGAPVERGQVLFELAPREGYRVALQVDEHDMADLQLGQTGTLRLAGFPDHTLSFTIDRIVPVAAAEAGGNYFRVEAALTDSPEELRPGMQGVAKVVVGRGSLLWIWTHELWDRLRLWVWSLGW